MLNQVANRVVSSATQMLAESVKLILMQTVLSALRGPSLAGNTHVVGERGPKVVTLDSLAAVSSNRAFIAAGDSMTLEADTFQQRNSEERQQRLDEVAKAFDQASSKPFRVGNIERPKGEAWMAGTDQLAITSKMD